MRQFGQLLEQVHILSTRAPRRMLEELAQLVHDHEDSRARCRRHLGEQLGNVGCRNRALHAQLVVQVDGPLNCPRLPASSRRPELLHRS